MTCAKCCLKYENRSCGLSERTAKRRVRAHRPVGLLAVLGHRGEEYALVLDGVPEGPLALQQGGRFGTRVGVGLGELVQVDLTLLQPAPVRLPPEQGPLDVLVVQQLVPLGVDDEHLPRLESPAFDHVLGGHPQGPVLGGHDDPAVPGDRVACGTQPVPVQRRSDDAAVGEGDRSGAVPRLHQGAVVPVEVAPVGVHQVVVLPGLGDHHGDRVRQAPPREVQELEGVVEGGRVALAWLDDRRELPEVLPEELRTQPALAGPHPVYVAPYGVDLTVVRDVAVGVRELPTPKGVGREPLVDERYGAGESRIPEVWDRTATTAGPSRVPCR